MKRMLNSLLAVVILGQYTQIASLADQPVAEAPSASTSDAAKPNSKKSDEWTIDEFPDGKLLLSQSVRAIAQAEPRPALKIRFLDDPIDQIDHNAAVYYLRAMGFLQEDANRIALTEYWRKSAQVANDTKVDNAKVPPDVWQSMHPKDLPIDEVKRYLSLTNFRTRDLALARKCKSMNFERHVKDAQSPAFILLPELDAMRMIAREQLIRCRLALAEDRMDDAIEVVRQQFAMAHHCTQDPLIVSNLVGFAIAQMVADDCIRLIEHDKCPNLYWAFATLPKPLVTFENSLGFEQRLLFEQVKLMNQVDLKPKEDAFWNALIESLATSMTEMQSEGWENLSESDSVAKLGGIIDRSQEKAIEYLSQNTELKEEAIRSLHRNHIAMLALASYAREQGDNMIKWAYVPYHQLRTTSQFLKFASEETKRTVIGELSSICNHFLVTTQIYAAQARVERKLALLQSVEAVRMYAAEHDGAPPATLNDTPMPAPLDPVTGQQFEYASDGSRFTITAPPTEVIGFRLRVELIAE